MTYTIVLEDVVAEFYSQVAFAAGLPLEQVLADSLLKLAGELALESLSKK